MFIFSLLVIYGQFLSRTAVQDFELIFTFEMKYSGPNWFEMIFSGLKSASEACKKCGIPWGPAEGFKDKYK